VLQFTAESVLGMRFISYTTPLALARNWSQSGDKALQSEARKLLEGLFERFPHSLEIGQQLALAYLENRQEAEAKAVLDKLSLMCRNPNEEVLSRAGRLYRDQGDRYVKYPEIGGLVESPPEALSYYRLALEDYTKAYRVRNGHYPGINVATLHLLIAAFETNATNRAGQLQCSQTIAQKLLDRWADWPLETDDDPVWHAATAGEANLLLNRWDAAAECYFAAQQHARFKSFHRGSMRKQVLRILYCHRRLGANDLGPFGNLADVLPETKPEETQHAKT
jgi:hypothetical protein